MSRWVKPDSEVQEASLKQREWMKTEAGQEYRRKRLASGYSKKYREANRDKVKAKQREANVRTRYEALSHYSGGEPICKCCGEKGLPFLTIDHIAGDGAAHRKEIMGGNGTGGAKTMGGNGFVYWLKKNGYPEGYQVLCANCNFAKRNNDCCPHQLTL